MEIKYIKSAAKLLKRNYVNKGGLNLSKEVLWVSVGQKTAVLWAVKVGGKKKFCRSARHRQVSFKPGVAEESFFF